jgi:hypothetical protein
MDTVTTARVVAAVLFVIVLAILIVRLRGQKKS